MTGRAAARLDEVRLAALLLTRVPVGRLRDPAPGVSAAAWAFPLIGAALGAAIWGVLALALWCGAPPGIAALLAAAAGVGLTGALHHDGLADFADGLWGGSAPARRLEIMRDSRIGSYGVLALIFAVALCVAGLMTGPGPVWVVLIGVASRGAMLATLIALPPARGDGLGQLGRGTPGRALWPGAVVLAGLVWIAGPAALVVLGACAVTAFGIARLAKLRLGGQTGDVLGAVQLSVEAAGWAVVGTLAP